TVTAAPVLSDRSWTTHFRKKDGKWAAVAKLDDELAKKHGLQGPIDDAFMDSFLIVRPTGRSENEKVGNWAQAEMSRAVRQWQKHFRGYARVKDDKAVTDEDIAEHNLVLWGDPASNRLLGRIMEKLPVRWSAKEVQVGKQSFDAGQHAVMLIYPN